MNAPDVFLEWWPVIFTGFLTLIWLVRLEMRVVYQRENLEDHKQEVRDYENRQKEQRAEDLAAGRRDFDKLESKLDGIQVDIKELIRRASGE